MKLSKKLLQAMTISLTIGAAVATTASSCSSLKENAEVSPEGEICTFFCGDDCSKHSNQTIDYCPPCGRG